MMRGTLLNGYGQLDRSQMIVVRYFHLFFTGDTPIIKVPSLIIILSQLYPFTTLHTLSRISIDTQSCPSRVSTTPGVSQTLLAADIHTNLSMWYILCVNWPLVNSPFSIGELGLVSLESSKGSLQTTSMPSPPPVS